MYMYIPVYTCTYRHTYMHACIHTRTYVHACMHTNRSIHMYSIYIYIDTYIYIYIYIYMYTSAFHSMAPCGGPLILLLLWSCWGWLFLGPRCFTAQITNMSSVVPSSSAPRSFTLPQCGTCPSIILRMQTSFLFRIGLGIWNLEFFALGYLSSGPNPKIKGPPKKHSN